MSNRDQRIVTITPLNTGPVSESNSLTVGLAGDATLQPASGTGTGGWQVVDRPKRVAATQWYDRAPWQLSFPAIIDKGFTGNRRRGVGGSVESLCHRLETWSNAIPGTLQPPIFAIAGPVPGIKYVWCLYSTEFDTAIRRPDTGERIQQNVQLTFYEYAPPLGSLSTTLPGGAVETYNYNASTGAVSFNLHEVVAGETLKKIANEYGTSVARIKELNDIRDPRSIVPGQTLLIPNG